jgi:hypothetical protein
VKSKSERQRPKAEDAFAVALEKLLVEKVPLATCAAAVAKVFARRGVKLYVTIEPDRPLEPWEQ